MSDEPKKVFSVPPPPTDEIDSEWGGKAADEKPTKTATQAADEAVAPASDSGPPGADTQLQAELAGQAETAAAPGTPPPAPVSHEDDDGDDEDEDDDGDDEDEDDDGDDEDEDDDEDDEHPVARSRSSHSPMSRTTAPGTDEWLPDWAPFAVLALLVVLGVAGGLGAFTKPPAEGASAAAATGGPAVAETTKPTSVEASHFLVMYKGSMRAPETVTRTKDEAKARALEGLAKLKKGEDFAKVVAEYSDEPGAGQRGGALGSFTPERMVKPFSDAAFALKVGQISGLVETPFGFHVIKRTK